MRAVWIGIGLLLALAILRLLTRVRVMARDADVDLGALSEDWLAHQNGRRKDSLEA